MQRGFSLIEMVIVLMIIGIIAVMAVPRYSDAADGYKLQSAQKQLLTTLDAWREQAHASAKFHTIYFDTGNEIIYLFDGTTRSVKEATDQLDLGSAPFEVGLHKTNLEDPINQLVINGFGLYEKDFFIRLVKDDMMLDVTIEGGGSSRLPVDTGVPVDLPVDASPPVDFGAGG